MELPAQKASANQTELEKRHEAKQKDQVEGKLHEVKGKVKETAGQVTNNSNLANKLTSGIRVQERDRLRHTPERTALILAR